jgi:hypothetical protein
MDEKWICKITLKALVRQESHFSYVRLKSRMGRLSAEYGLKTPIYSITRVTALSTM